MHLIGLHVILLHTTLFWSRKGQSSAYHLHTHTHTHTQITFFLGFYLNIHHIEKYLNCHQLFILCYESLTFRINNLDKFDIVTFELHLKSARYI